MILDTVTLTDIFKILDNGTVLLALGFLGKLIKQLRFTVKQTNINTDDIEGIKKDIIDLKKTCTN